MMQVKLNLTIEGKWFDMIARGEKLEEYCGFAWAQMPYESEATDGGK